MGEAVASAAAGLMTRGSDERRTRLQHRHRASCARGRTLRRNSLLDANELRGELEELVAPSHLDLYLLARLMRI